MAKAGITSELRAIAATVEVPIAEGAPARRIMLFPMGTHIGRDGRGPYTLDDRRHAEAVIAATRADLGATALMVDYDHQSANAVKPEVGGQAPASGWIDPGSLTAADDGIWGDVEWTARANQQLADREYRYVSPWFGFTRAEGRLTRFFSIGLVNRPNLDLPAVAAQSTTGEAMDLTKLAAALGLGADATEEQIFAAIRSNKEGAATAATQLGAVATALGLAGNASAEDIATAAQSRPAIDPRLFVPRAEFDRMKAQVDTLGEDRATAAVDQAIADRKIAPASRDWALGYVKADPAGFAAFIGTAPEVLPEGSATAGRIDPKSDSLSAEEKAVCAQLGVSEADYLKTRKGDA